VDADRKAAGGCEHEQLQHDERRERNEERVRRRGGHIGGQGDGDRNNGRDGGAAESLDNVHSHRGEAQFFPRDGGISRGYRRNARGALPQAANKEADERGGHRVLFVSKLAVSLWQCKIHAPKLLMREGDRLIAPERIGTYP
jgi:hypothetical protein